MLEAIQRPLTPLEMLTALIQQKVLVTPHNLTDLEQHIDRVKAFLSKRAQRSVTPPSPSDLALDSLLKGCTIAMSIVVLLKDQNEKVFAENERQKQKRQ